MNVVALDFFVPNSFPASIRKEIQCRIATRIAGSSSSSERSIPHSVTLPSAMIAVGKAIPAGSAKPITTANSTTENRRLHHVEFQWRYLQEVQAKVPVGRWNGVALP